MAKMPPMEDKEFEARGGQYFDAGVHEVFINKVSRGVSKAGNEYIEFEVTDKDNERTARPRRYLSEAAAPHTRRELMNIAVHNKETEEQKQQVRDAFRNILDTDKFDQKFLDKFESMQAWIKAEEDLNAPKPNGGYYLKYDIYGYEPKQKKTTVEDIMGGGTPVDTGSDSIPF